MSHYVILLIQMYNLIKTCEIKFDQSKLNEVNVRSAIQAIIHQFLQDVGLQK